MKQFFAMKLHSFSDVITNSSTDIFACVDTKSVDVIRDILVGMYFTSMTLEDFRKSTCHTPYQNDYCYTKDEKIKFFTENIATVELKTVKEYYDDVHPWLEYDWERKKEPLTVENFIKGNSYRFKDCTSESKIIVVCGVSSNTIPYWMDQFICDELNAYRIHMG